MISRWTVFMMASRSLLSSSRRPELPGLFPAENRKITRFIVHVLCAADEALRDANSSPTKQEDKAMTGVSVGGGTGSISDVVVAAQMICEKRLHRLSPFFIPRILINMASGHISMKYGFQGPNHAAIAASATCAHSIGDAARMIQFGVANVMVARGTESSIDALSIAGFCKYDYQVQFITGGIITAF